jgi:hypothetical protein
MEVAFGEFLERGSTVEDVVEEDLGGVSREHVSLWLMKRPRYRTMSVL